MATPLLLRSGSSCTASRRATWSCCCRRESTKTILNSGVTFYTLNPTVAAQWVIVYGFKAGDVELLLSEFGKCGDIAQHGTFGAPASANWLYLQFQVAPTPAAYLIYLHQIVHHVGHGDSAEAACEHGTRAPNACSAAASMQCHTADTIRPSVCSSSNLLLTCACFHRAGQVGGAAGAVPGRRAAQQVAHDWRAPPRRAAQVTQLFGPHSGTREDIMLWNHVAGMMCRRLAGTNSARVRHRNSAQINKIVCMVLESATRPRPSARLSASAAAGPPSASTWTRTPARSGRWRPSRRWPADT